MPESLTISRTWVLSFGDKILTKHCANGAKVPIQNYHGAQVGWLKVELRVRAWDEEEGKGKGRGHDDQRLLVGRNMSVTVGIISARSLPRSVDQCFCKYRFFDLETITTSKQSGPNPVFSHQKTFLFRPLTQQLVDYFKEGTLTIDVFVTYRTEEKRPQIGGTLRRNPSTGGGSEGRNATTTRRSRSSTSSTRASGRRGREEEKGIGNGTVPTPEALFQMDQI